MKRAIDVKRVTATDLRGKLKDCLREARANRVVLVENRRQSPKYLVDKDFLDSLVKERESIIATLEILADRQLTDRLISLSKTLDEDIYRQLEFVAKTRRLAEQLAAVLRNLPHRK
jgi:hypothetical protein